MEKNAQKIFSAAADFELIVRALERICIFFSRYLQRYVHHSLVDGFYHLHYKTALKRLKASRLSINYF